jgi:hypothetical protein
MLGNTDQLITVEGVNTTVQYQNHKIIQQMLEVKTHYYYYYYYYYIADDGNSQQLHVLASNRPSSGCTFNEKVTSV